MTHADEASASADVHCRDQFGREAPMRNVEGKVAFVTGGDSGIGLGIARAFATAGMKVVITYRTESHLEEALRTLHSAGSRVHSISVDVTDRAAMAAAAQEAARVFGKVHVLVNNAGVAPGVPLSSATFDDWDWCMGVNVHGVFNGIRTFLPYLRAHSEGGQIVSTASMLGGLVVGPFWGVYSTTKFAVVGMMEALRAELARTNIGVSVFCPAGVKTNVGLSQRNRPATLGQVGEADPETQTLIRDFAHALQKARADNAEPPMDPMVAGEWVLRGIRNNDLYIISHPEHEQTLRERNEALLASIPRARDPLSAGSIAVAQIMRTPIYADEIRRKLRQETQS